MIELLKRLLIGHTHKWVMEDIINVTGDSGDTIGKIVILRCKVCGVLKNHDIKWE